MLRSRFMIKITALVLFLNMACQPSKGQSSQTKHDLNQITWDTDPLQWLTLDKDTYSKANKDVSIVEESGPMYQRLNYWLAYLDNMLRSKAPFDQQLINTPKPILKIARGFPSASAWISSVRVCYSNIRLRFEGALTSNPVNIDDACTVQRRANRQEEVWSLLSFLDKIGKDEQDDCQLDQFQVNETNSGAFEIKIPKTCVDPDSQDLDFLPIIQTGNWVSVSLESLAVDSELRTVRVLAHELSHYYRGHGNSDRYNFYYEITPNYTGSRPKPAEKGSIHDKLGEHWVKWIEFYSSVLSVHNELLTAFPEYKDKDRNFLDSIKVAFDYEFFNESFAKDQFAKILAWLNSTPESTARQNALSRLAELQLTLSQFEEPFQDLVVASKEVHLGQYTVEQEADELAGEILASAGIDPVQAFVESNLNNDSACATRLKKGWKRIGVFIAEPVGTYIDEHHESCFRVFNAEREAAAHQYQAPADGWRQLSSFPGWTAEDQLLDWSAFQSKAKTYLSP